MKNNYTIEGDTVKIEMKRKDKEPAYTLIDLADLPILEAFQGTWHLKYDKKDNIIREYAYAHVRREDGGYTTTQLHRLLMKPSNSKEYVDHINHNCLDNRRANLRPVNGTQNQYNRYIGINNQSGTLGLSWHKQKRKWKAELLFKRQPIFAKYYADKDQAIRDLEMVREALTKVVMVNAQ